LAGGPRALAKSSSSPMTDVFQSPQNGGKKGDGSALQLHVV